MSVELDIKGAIEFHTKRGERLKQGVGRLASFRETVGTSLGPEQYDISQGTSIEERHKLNTRLTEVRKKIDTITFPYLQKAILHTAIAIDALNTYQTVDDFSLRTFKTKNAESVSFPINFNTMSGIDLKILLKKNGIEVDKFAEMMGLSRSGAYRIFNLDEIPSRHRLAIESLFRK